MSELIKREDAIKMTWIESQYFDPINVLTEVRDRIKALPTVDAVSVVRCKECKWWDKDEDSIYGYCLACKHGYHTANWEIDIYRKQKEDFYCADGERKGDGK